MKTASFIRSDTIIIYLWSGLVDFTAAECSFVVSHRHSDKNNISGGEHELILFHKPLGSWD